MRANQQILPEAARLENARRDGSVVPRNAVVAKLQHAELALQEASIAVSQYYRQCSPEQQQRLDHVELRLHHAMDSQVSARLELNAALPAHRNTLSKDGLSQFNAAARGDPRSMEAQQNKPVKMEVVPIRASRGIGDPTSLDQNQGTAMAAFMPAAKGMELSRGPQLASQQVEDSQPRPQPRPSLDMAAGVDRIQHAKAKGQDSDRARSLNETYERIAKRLENEQSLRDENDVSQDAKHNKGLGR